MSHRIHLPTIALIVAFIIIGAGCVPAGADPEGVAADPRQTTSSVDASAGSSPDPVVWAIGDSLMVGAADQLVDARPTMLIDAQEGRTFESGIDVLEHQLAAGSPDVLILALGTNNGATSEQVERVMRLASDIDKVVFVNVSVPRPWESATNASLFEAAAIYATATLADWKAESEAGTGLFRADGYHLTTEGIDAWVAMIMAEAAD
ncbi:MAG: hypothetical protein M3094_01635, partial [Actinomycetia bacterium]|nr:hypothetical protein [Actinomycetes bacterium]